MQLVKLAISTDGSATLIPADATGGLTVTANLAAGTNNVGDVDVLSIAAGNNNIGDVDIASIAAGDNNIGNVDIVSLPASTNTLEVVGDAAHDAVAAGNPVLIGGYASAAAPADISADGDVARIWTTVKGAVHVADAGGTLSVDDGASSLTVDGTVTANLAAGTNNIGDVDVLSIAAGDNNIGNVDIVTMPNVTLAAGTNTNEVVGDAAHDAAAAGNPLMNGLKAETAPSGVTAVADGDASYMYGGADGILYVRPYCALEDILSGVDSDTAGDSTSVIAAQGAGIRIYVTSVIVKNAHASTDAYVDIRDGTAGSVLASIPAPAAGGAVVNFPVPLRLTANTACAVDPSAAVTTIITTVVGFKAAV